MTTGSYVQTIGDGGSSGTVFGSASGLHGFYGATPIAKPATTSQSAVATTTITTLASTSLTALDLTSINALIARVEAIRVLQAEMRTNMINLGLIKGSA